MMATESKPPQPDDDVSSALLDDVRAIQYTARHPLVDLNLYEYLYNALPVSQITTMAAAVITVLLFAGDTPLLGLIVWLLLVTGLAATRIYSASTFKIAMTAEGDLRKWRIIFHTGALTMGLVWGIGTAILAPVNSVMSAGYVCVLIAGMGAGAVSSLAASPVAFMTFTAACYLPPILMFLIWRPLEQQMLGVVMLVLWGALFALAKRQYDDFLNSILLKINNDNLMRQLRRDFAGQQQTAQRLEESEARYRDLFDNASDMIFSIYLDGTFAYANQTWLDTMGYSAEELPALKYRDTLAAEAWQSSAEVTDRLSQGLSVKEETRFLTRSGGILLVEGAVTSRLMNGKPYLLRCIYRDITERKKMAASLEAARRQYEDIVNNASDIIFTADIKGNFTMVNTVSTRITGYPAASLTRMNYLDLIPMDYKQQAQHHFRYQLINLIPETRYEYPILSHSGDLIWVSQNTQLVFENGVPVMIRAVARDITAQKAAEIALQQAYAEVVDAKDLAESSRHAEEKFIATVSHEIRTPMNAVTGFIDLLSGTRLTRTQQEYVRNLNNSSLRLLKIVNDLLEFKRIQAGKVEFISNPFSLQEALDMQISIFSNQANSKGVRLRYVLDPAVPPRLTGDDARLGQILQNLISNAIKYTQQGEVIIRVEKGNVTADSAVLRFTVEDTGAGIPAAKLESIFNVYEQVDVRRDAQTGSGLGLSIFKSLVELQGGTISVTSTPGQGSCFGFTLQFGIPREASAVQTGASAASLLSQCKPMSLLLVDDDEMNIFLALKYLEVFSNIKLTTAGHGGLALEALRKQPFDLILTDINMPVMDGYELVRRIRTECPPPVSTAPVIALTAELSPQEKLRAAGMDDYLLKPFTRESLYKKIYEIMTARQ